MTIENFESTCREKFELAKSNDIDVNVKLLREVSPFHSFVSIVPSSVDQLFHDT